MMNFIFVLVTFLLWGPAVVLAADGSPGPTGGAFNWTLFVGATYGALQAISNVLTLVLPKHTVAWRLAHWMLTGSRPG